MKDKRAMHAMQASLTAARDAQIAQVVALVDAMPDRGDADALLAPLRGRLARLRPPRPIGFNRLLFTPIDPLIVPATVWRRGNISVPRTALTPIGVCLRQMLADISADIDAESRLGTTEGPRLTELGTNLWASACSALQDMPIPPAWHLMTGLAPTDYAPIATCIAAVLSVAADIQAAVAQLPAPLPDTALRTILGRTAPRGAPALSAVVAVLLARLPGSGRIVSLATEAAGNNPPLAVDAAVEHALDMLQAAMESESAIGQSMAQATQDAARVTALLQEVDVSAAIRPERKRRIDRLRRSADALCRTRFESALQDELLNLLESLSEEPNDAEVNAIECSARGLRRLEANARLLGGGEHYDAILQGSVTPFMEHDSPLSLADRVRLVEILAGPDRALAMIG